MSETVTHVPLTDDGPDYRWCGFPGTRLRFRGPAPDISAPYVAMLGGTETFGKYVRRPFPALVSDWTGLPVLNLGVAHAGLSLFGEERWLLDTASRAELTVLQVPGAQNMSNRLYSVHSRRNDRFLGASPALGAMYPDVDFAEINFTGHLIETLSHGSPAAFSTVVAELRPAWVRRMRRVIETIRGDVLLLWIADRQRPARLEDEPLFVDRDMLDQVMPGTVGLVEVVLPESRHLDGKAVPPGEEKAALRLPGPAGHARIAEALIEALSRMDIVPGHAHGAARAMGS